MKAYVCREFGPVDSHKVEEIEDPRAEPGMVVIDVKAAGVSFPDVLIVQGKYQFQPPMPFTPGSEVAGKIKKTGAKLQGYNVGDRVMATPGIGGLAELVAVKSDGLRKIPDNMNFKTAASFAMVYTTSYYALKQRANLKSGETLLVLGSSGGVGLTAVELGKLFGAKVIAAASSDEKLEFVKQLKPDYLLNYNECDLKEAVKDLTEGRGADVIYDPVGGDLFDQCCRCINWNGRLLVIGFTSGRIPSYKANLALLKGSAMVGVFLGRFRKEEPQAYEQNFRELLDMYREGKLNPIVTKSFALEDFVDAFNIFNQRKAMGKVTLELKQE